MVPRMALIRGNGGLNIIFYARDLEKTHPCADLRVLACFVSKSVQGIGLTLFGAQSRACMRGIETLADRDELLHRCSGPRRNYFCQWLSLMGFRRGGAPHEGSNFGLLRWLASSTVALNTHECECVTAERTAIYTTQFSHKCSKIRIGNRTQAFEWCHFKWPWVTPNLDFKVTTLFNAKTVQKQVTYNGRPIVSCIWSIERRHIQRPWTTLTYDFKVTPLFDAEYLRNDTRFRHIIFNWILIGTYIRPTQQCHFEWP